MTISNNSYSQLCVNVSGSITDTSDIPLQSVIIIITTTESKLYVTSNEKGIYKMKFCFANKENIHEPILISYRLLGYGTTEIQIHVKNENNELPKIRLVPANKILKEVVVKSKPILQNNDTTSFLVSAFKNKTDTNLEDILQRMPGFDIDGNGKITYNNRPIENILIEGTELAKNYKLISKNIPPDAIGRLEMIENYEQNSLVKGLSTTKKQVMNLTLSNPNQLKVFGNFKTGIGVRSVKNLAGNLFNLNSRIKSIMLGNVNNIGINPYDEISFDQSSVQAKEYEFDNSIISQIIDEDKLFGKSATSVTPLLLNDSKMVTANGSFIVSKKNNFKLFIDHYTDEIRQSYVSSFSNLIDNTLSYKTYTQKYFNPKNGNLFAEFKHLNNREQLLINLIVNRKNYFENDNILSTLNYKSNLYSEFFRTGIGIYYTRRIDSTKLFEITSQFVFDKKNQSYLTVQDQLREIDSLNKADELNQESDNQINYIRSDMRFLYKGKKGTKSEFRLTNFSSITNLGSNLYFGIGNATLASSIYQNNSLIVNNRLQLTFNSQFQIGTWQLSTSMGVNYFRRSYDLNTNTSIKHRKLNPFLLLSGNKKISRFADMNFSFEFNEFDPPNVSVLQNAVMTSFRTQVKRTPRIERIAYLQSNISYIYKNINKGISFIASWIYFNRKNNEVSNILFNKDFDLYTYRYSHMQQYQHTFFTKFDKYISKFKTSINYKQSFNWFSNPIEVNKNILSSRNFVYTGSLSFKPTFSNSINFTFGSSYNLNKDIQSKKANWQLTPFINSILTLSDEFSIGINNAKQFDNYSDKINSYHFMNLFFWYTSMKPKIDFKFSFNNLLNINTIYSGVRNNLFNSYTQQYVLPRFILLEASYKL